MNITNDRSLEVTGFQEAAHYRPEINLQTDFVMVYGVDKSMPERVAKWREKGYVIHLMTGVAWGGYLDYLSGEYDAEKRGEIPVDAKRNSDAVWHHEEPTIYPENHLDEAQRNSDGTEIVHGRWTPYMCPTTDFADYLTEKLRVAVDAGVEAIHLEEPEFWVGGGYSEAFKREWRIFYGEDWVSPDSDPDNQFKASRLKAYLYRRMLDRLCGSLKTYSMRKYGRALRFYVPTHSLINYSHWKIVSPESGLIDLPSVDGYIAQIWTGTSRTSNMLRGVAAERTFYTAYLEYGVMQELVRGTDKKMWFLHDPIEDNPRYGWEDYVENYRKTLIASLLHKGVASFEVCPWPSRVWGGSYPRGAEDAKPMPEGYSTELGIIYNVLRDLEAEQDKASDNIGILMSDTAMYQRLDFGRSEENAAGGVAFSAASVEQNNLFSNFYGAALPLVDAGLELRPVQLDNVTRYDDYLKDFKTLILSYEFCKPEHASIHTALAQWVQDGGQLIYVGDDSDVYNSVGGFWSSAGTAREHLFNAVGKENLTHFDHAPADIAASGKLSDKYVEFVRGIHPFEDNKYFSATRGAYVVAATVDGGSWSAKGRLVNLFDPNISIVDEWSIAENATALLLDLDKIQANGVTPVAGTGRTTVIDGGYNVIGQQGMNGITRFVYDGAKPSVTADADITVDFDAEGSFTVKYICTESGINIYVK